MSLPVAQKSAPAAAPRGRASSNVRFEGLLSQSSTMWELFAACDAAARSDATVLIVGETGSGKDLLARAVHRRSGRRGRFVALNAASVPHNLIEAELFGHERGAFTGADRPKRGAVRHANGGTLFLDEIADMPALGQTSLLRFLQEGTVRPVGSYEELAVDVRVVAATNVPPWDAVNRGTLRQDLFYRLDVVRIEVPPLREREGDALFLFHHFHKKLAAHYKREGPPIAESFLEVLDTHAWPGNVRQLRNLAERIVLSGRRSPLRASDARRMLDAGRKHRGHVPEARGSSPELPAPPAAAPARATSIDQPQATRRGRADLEEGGGNRLHVDLSRSLSETLETSVEQVERAYLTAALEKAHGRVSDAAHIAGVSRRTLHRKMEQLNLDKRSFKLPQPDG